MQLLMQVMMMSLAVPPPASDDESSLDSSSSSSDDEGSVIASSGSGKSSSEDDESGSDNPIIHNSVVISMSLGCYHYHIWCWHYCSARFLEIPAYGSLWLPVGRLSIRKPHIGE